MNMNKTPKTKRAPGKGKRLLRSISSISRKKFSMAGSAKENGEDRRDSVDVDVLRRQRQDTFREVGFAEVAEHKVVNGYSSIAIAPSTPVEDRDYAHASASCLSTPLIDISDLGGGDGGRPSSSARLQRRPLPPGLISPEAGLHRDGEQARLVEAARRRQEERRQHYEENAFQWLEESAAQFWESILVYGGMMEDPRVGRSHHPTLPENPYRDESRSTLDDVKPNHGQNGQASSSSDSKTKAENDRPASHSNSIADRPPPSRSNSLPKHRRVIRFILRALLRVICAVRWSVDVCVARLASLEPPPPDASLLSTYSTSPAYSLRVTADDILRSSIILWLSFYFISWARIFALPVAIIMCLYVGLVGRRVVARVQPLGDQHRVQQQHAKQSIAIQGDASSTINQPKFTTPTKLIPKNDCEGSIQRLQKQFPNATIAECNRFFKCTKFKEQAASKRLNEFFKWRSECGLKTVAEVKDSHRAEGNTQHIGGRDRIFDQAFATKDESDWVAAAKTAISIVTKTPVAQIEAALPQIICSYEERLLKEDVGADHKPDRPVESSLPPPRCRKGTRILHILPARIDLSLAASPTYSLAAALYLDRRLCRSTTERISLVVELRGGKGWANPKPWSILPFIQSTASLLGGHYPERLERLVLFPMPKSAIWVWSAAEKFLDPDTSSKVVVVSSGNGSELPERLSEFIAEESLDVLENRRRSFFVDSS